MKLNLTRVRGLCLLGSLACFAASLFPVCAWADSLWKEWPLQMNPAKSGASADNELRSIFAVVTQKGGVASAFAHNHFIVARNYEINVQPGSSVLEPAKVTLQFDAKNLEVDPFKIAEFAAPRLVNLGLSHAQFTDLSASDRKTIAENMLAEDQLNAAKYPVIEVEASNFRQKGGQIGTQESNYEADFVFKIRGSTVKKVVPLLISQREVQEGGSPVSLIQIEGLVSEKFQSFGFNAYSGLLGAVKNKDEFHFYLKTEGTWIKKQ